MSWTSATTWRVGRLPIGRYNWRIRARTGDLVGEWSGDWEFTVADVPYRRTAVPVPGPYAPT